MWWFGTTENTMSTEPPNHIKAKEGWSSEKKNRQNNNNNNKKYIRFFTSDVFLLFFHITFFLFCYFSSFHPMSNPFDAWFALSCIHSIQFACTQHTAFFISIHFFGNFFCLCLFSGTFTIYFFYSLFSSSSSSFASSLYFFIRFPHFAMLNKCNPSRICVHHFNDAHSYLLNIFTF